jgi:hypothetical protein
VLLTHKIQLQEQLEEISVLMSEETSVTDPMQLMQLKDKLNFGSNKNNKLTTGLHTQNNGSMNDLFDCI